MAASIAAVIGTYSKGGVYISPRGVGIFHCFLVLKWREKRQYNLPSYCEGIDTLNENPYR